jgi:hypothetical protein
MKHRNLVLVDFDGVILKNQAAALHIANKAHAYVAKTCRLLPDRKGVEKLNKELYTSSGHTVIGLNKHGIKSSLKDFNRFVYDDVWKYKSLQLTEDEKNAWLLFVQEMKKLQVDIRFFSNASYKWIKHFMTDDLASQDMYELQYHIDSYAHEPHYDTLLKPERHIYENVMYRYPRRMYYVLDDKIHNFQAISHDPRWIKVWMSGCGDSSWMVKRKISTSFFAVDQLSDAAKLIAHIENAC